MRPGNVPVLRLRGVYSQRLSPVSLALDDVLSGVRREKLAIEARLALGATPQQAFSTLLRESVRRGIVPRINQMSAAYGAMRRLTDERGRLRLDRLSAPGA